MDYSGHVAGINDQVAPMLDAVGSGPLDATVPTCPDFSVDELAVHVGNLCGYWTGALRGAPRDAPEETEQVLGTLGAEGRRDWLAGRLAELTATLAHSDATTECRSWYEPDQTAGFAARRVAHELAMHRVDLQLARGSADPIDAALASDGIDEFFVVQAYGATLRTDVEHGVGQRIHLHGTDAASATPSDGALNAEWLITLGPDGTEVTHEHAKGDLAIRASISDLELLLYRRSTLGAVEHFGDTSVLDFFYREFAFG